VRFKVPCLVLVLALGGAGYAALAADRGDVASATVAAAKRTRELRLSGHVEGLYPGAVAELLVKVQNPLGRRVVLRSITVDVTGITGGGGPRCSATHLIALTSHPRVRVPRHGTRRVPVPIAMSSQAPDDCEGAGFGLRLHAAARVRGRR
jgi:hypothetical protein